MSLLMLTAGILAGAWLAAVVYCDLSSKLLPNVLTLGGALVVLAVRAAINGWTGVIGGCLAGALAGAFLLVPFFFRAAGGGDVKLLFAMGVLAGWPRVLTALFWISLVGFVFAVVFLLSASMTRRRLRHALMTMCNPFYDREAGRPTMSSSRDLRMSFGTPIVLGTLMAFVVPM